MLISTTTWQTEQPWGPDSPNRRYRALYYDNPAAEPGTVMRVAARLDAFPASAVYNWTLVVLVADADGGAVPSGTYSGWGGHNATLRAAKAAATRYARKMTFAALQGDPVPRYGAWS